MTTPSNDPSGERAIVFAAILKAQPGTDAHTQRGRILSAIKQLGSCTTFEASRYLDCYDPRARVHDLRKRGTDIITVMRRLPTESGALHSVGVYMMAGGVRG